MTIISKASLSRELGISKSRVSQLVREGMPVREDGKLDRDSAVAWVKRNIASAPRLTPSLQTSTETRSPSDILGEQIAALTTEPFTAGEVFMAAILLHRIGSLAAIMALECGASFGSAHALERVMPVALGAEIEDLFADRVPGFGEAPLLQTSAMEKVDWRKLADEAGEPYEPAAWKRAAKRRPVFNPASKAD